MQRTSMTQRVEQNTDTHLKQDIIRYYINGQMLGHCEEWGEEGGGDARRGDNMTEEMSGEARGGTVYYQCEDKRS